MHSRKQDKSHKINTVPYMQQIITQCIHISPKQKLSRDRTQLLKPSMSNIKFHSKLTHPYITNKFYFVTNAEIENILET